MRMSKKGMRDMVAWAIKWSLHPGRDEVSVVRRLSSGEQATLAWKEFVKEMRKTWPGLSFILAKDNEVVCTLKNDQVFSIKITIPRSPQQDDRKEK